VFSEIKRVAVTVLIVFGLIALIRIGFMVVDWNNWQQMDHIWELKDGEIIQIK